MKAQMSCMHFVVNRLLKSLISTVVIFLICGRAYANDSLWVSSLCENSPTVGGTTIMLIHADGVQEGYDSSDRRWQDQPPSPYSQLLRPQTVVDGQQLNSDWRPSNSRSIFSVQCVGIYQNHPTGVFSTLTNRIRFRLPTADTNRIYIAHVKRLAQYNNGVETNVFCNIQELMASNDGTNGYCYFGGVINVTNGNVFASVDVAEPFIHSTNVIGNAASACLDFKSTNIFDGTQFRIDDTTHLIGDVQLQDGLTNATYSFPYGATADAASNYFTYSILATNGAVLASNLFCHVVITNAIVPTCADLVVHLGRHGIVEGTFNVSSNTSGILLTETPTNGILLVSGTNFTFTPFNAPGEFTANYQATNDAGASVAALYKFIVTNTPPVAEYVSELFGPRNAMLSQTISGSDVDGDPLTLRLINPSAGVLPSGLTLQATSASLNGHPGSVAVQFCLDDPFNGSSQTNSAIFTFTNSPPVANPGDAVSGARDEALSQSILGSDPDGDSIAASLVNPPEGVTLSGTTIQATSSSLSGAPGELTVNFCFRDSFGAYSFTNAATFRFTNRPPSATGGTYISSKTRTASATISASDPDGDFTQVYLASSQTGVSVSEHGITVTPGNIATNLSVSFYVSDIYGAKSATNIFSFIFTNAIPVATNGTITTSENTSVPIDTLALCSDPDADTLAVEIVQGPTNGVFSQGVYSPTTDFYGSDFISFRANDGMDVSSIASVQINVIGIPQILNQPISVTNILGTQARFSISARGSDLTYLWQKDSITLADGDHISGAATPSLTLSNITGADEGAYSVIISNSLGSIVSSNALLTVGFPPRITTQPQSRTNAVGSLVVFSVSAEGTSPFGYRWHKDAIPLDDNNHISGAFTRTLSISNVSATDSGSYSVLITNIAGSVMSSSAGLAVIGLPSITSQPSSFPRALQGTNVLLSVIASSSAPLSYQWRVGSVDIAGATDSVYSFIAQPIAGSTNLEFSVLVSNLAGTVTSANAMVTIIRDTVLPTVKILSPAANARTDALSISGTATDVVRVTKVLYWITNVFGSIKTPSVTNEAVLSGGLTSVTWSATPAYPLLLPGTNILTVQSVDLAGNKSAIATRTFFYKIQTPFSLTALGDGGGTITLAPCPSITGESSIRLSPINQTPPLWPTLSTPLYVGEGYKLIVSPNSGSWFENWSGDLNSTNATIQFVAASNMVVALNLRTNLFIKSWAGTYNGLFAKSDEVSEETAGAITLTVGKAGTYSGKIFLNGTNSFINGKFSRNGDSLCATTNGRTGEVVQFDLQLGTPGSGMLTGVVNNLTAAWQGICNTFKADLLNTNQAMYTIAVPPAPDAPSSSPGGYGYATIACTKGKALFSGTLSDGVKMSGTFYFPAAGTIPVYLDLYNHTGLLFGWLNTASNSSALTWIKKANQWTNYPAGFTNSIDTMLSPFSKALPGTNIFLAAPHHAEIKDADLLSPLAFDVTITNLTSYALAKIATTPTNSLSISFGGKTALMSGTFGNGVGRSTKPVYGVVLQNTNAAYGFFIGTNGQTGTVHIH